MMQNTTLKLYSLDYNDWKTYKMALLFVVANIVFPQICHYFGTGAVWLPIYFFTLVGAYKYGWKVGMLTALFSPLTSHFHFGMPVGIMLPVVMVRSVVLALVASAVSFYFRKLSLLLLLLVVVGSFLLGGVADLLVRGDLYHAWQSQLTGVPGMLLQIFGGYAVLKALR